MTISNEQFIDSNNEIDVNQCNFVPWGPDLKSCNNYCLNTDSKLKELYNVNNKCDLETCVNICKNCKNKERCQWYTKNMNNKDEEVGTGLNLTYKKEPKIIKLNWNSMPIVNNYMIHYKQTAPEYEQTKIIYKNTNSLELSIDNSNDNNIILNKDSTYTFKVYGTNNFGIVESSNIITVST